MTTEVKTYKWGSNRLWTRIGLVSGLFALLICVLLVANYVQYKKADPVNMTVINSLVERLRENPADSLLQKEIRTLDLLSRKAYFTSTWQIRTGGYLLLFSVALVIISFQIIEYRRKITPVLASPYEDETLLQHKKARRWIIAGGSLILITAVVFGVLSADELSDKLNRTASGESGSFEQSLTSGEVAVTELNAGTSDSVEIVAINADTDSAVDAISEVPSTRAVSNDNYPGFRVNAGVVSKRNVPVSWSGSTGTNMLWKEKVPLSGQSSPVIWGDNVFVTGASIEKQEVYCLDANTGKLKWTGRVGNGSKKPRVNEETGYAAPTAATDGAGVYAIFATGDIAGFELSGKKLWEKDLGIPDNPYGHASSLLVYDGKVIVQYDQRTSQKIMALSAKTGATVWSTNRTVKTSWSSPILVNTGSRSEIITVAEPYVAAYNPLNGKELWKIESIGGEVGPSAAYANGLVFAVNDYSTLCAIKTGIQPAIQWENNELLSDIPSPVANDKYLFLATSYGVLACYDAATGEKYWEKDFGKSIYSSPVIAENKVYLMDATGVMHIVSSDKEYRLVGESALGEYSAATPAFTNGRIYIRGVDHIYCFGK
jgi:outer membrane protein assembly factor BamB